MDGRMLVDDRLKEVRQSVRTEEMDMGGTDGWKGGQIVGRFNG